MHLIFSEMCCGSKSIPHSLMNIDEVKPKFVCSGELLFLIQVYSII